MEIWRNSKLLKGMSIGTRVSCSMKKNGVKRTRWAVLLINITVMEMFCCLLFLAFNFFSWTSSADWKSASNAAFFDFLWFLSEVFFTLLPHFGNYEAKCHKKGSKKGKPLSVKCLRMAFSIFSKRSKSLHTNTWM